MTFFAFCWIFQPIFEERILSAQYQNAVKTVRLQTEPETRRLLLTRMNIPMEEPGPEAVLERSRGAAWSVVEARLVLQSRLTRR